MKLTGDAERVCAALSWDPDDASIQIEPLVTLPHSFVARVRRAGQSPLLFKQAGSPDFAPGIRKELIVNRDVLGRFSAPVGPAFVAGDESAAMPWILFEDLAVSHSAPHSQTPPYAQIEAFVASLARTHVQARALPLQDFFANVPGHVHISDGGEYVPQVLDAFLQEVDGERFPPRGYALVRKIRDNIPLIAQMLPDDQTLVHGDAHFGNAMYAAGDALLIDWAQAVIGPGEVDLAHALAMNLPRLFSSEYEEQLIRSYVETCGIYGHQASEADVLERYRRCLLLTVVVAVGMRTVPGMSDQVWGFLFANTLHAALDHDVLTFL